MEVLRGFIFICLCVFTRTDIGQDIACPHYCQCQLIDNGDHVVRSICLFNKITSTDTLDGLDFQQTTWLQLVCLNPEALSEISPDAFYRLNQLIRLDIFSCNFGSITDTTFPGISPTVKNFTLVSSNPTIERAWISSATNYQHLDLSLNKLSMFPEGYFCELESLKSLNISYNSFEDFDDLGIQCAIGQSGCDICLPELDTLDISDGEYGTLDVRLSENMPNLKNFVAQISEIREIEEFIFQGLSKIEHIDLAWNALEYLPDDIFKNLPNLISISIAGNEFFNLNPEIFASTGQLKYLDVSSNFISDVGLFNETLAFLEVLENLRYLDLSSNFFFELSSDILQNKPELTKLRMLFCDLGEIEEGVFQNAPKIEALNMGGNVLTSVKENTFMGLTKLKLLVLASNEIADIHPRAFDHVSSIERLFIFRNSLSQLPETFKSLVNLKELYVGDNQFETLDADILNSLQNLREVYFDGNYLTSLPENMFGPGNQVEVIDLSYNSIESIQESTFTYMDNLKKLWINTNYIKTIGSSLFRLPSLLELDLSFNEIEELKAQSFPNSLMRLNISHNTITRVSQDAFQGMQEIESISLVQNELGYFPPTNIRTLGASPPKVSVQGNPQHSCQCRQITDSSILTCEKGHIRHYGQLLSFNDYIQRADIVCQYNSDCSVENCDCCGEDNCHCATTCPIGCSCFNSYDRSIDMTTCTSSNIQAIPPNLPISTTHLKLAGASIGRLKSGSLDRYSNLRELYLNSTEITEVEPGVFEDFENLAILRLDSNHIVSFDPSIFKKLPNLNDLHLEDNKITQFDFETFDYRGATFKVTLGGNPWLCDCNFGHLFKAWLEQRLARITDVEDITCGSVDLQAPSQLVYSGIPVVNANFSECGELPDDLFREKQGPGINSPEASNDGVSTKSIIIGSAVGGVLLLVLATLTVTYVCVRRKNSISKTNNNPSPKTVFQKHMGRTWRSVSSRYSNGGYDPDTLDGVSYSQSQHNTRGLGSVL